MRMTWIRPVAMILALVATCVVLAQRPGDLVVTPTRIILDDKARSGDVTLVNRGSQTVRYRLTLVDMEMLPDGQLKRVSSSANSAIGFLRLSPREVVLEPGVSQRIKVAATFPVGMGDQEIRSHLAFEPISIPKLPADRQEASSTLKLSFVLRSVVTIPVIARHGHPSASAEIGDCTVSKDAEGFFARFKLSRSGSRTIRGDVSATFVSANGSRKTDLGFISGLPLYFPNTDRIVIVRFTQDVRSLGKGEILIRFEEGRSRGAVMVKTTVAPPQ